MCSLFLMTALFNDLSFLKQNLYRTSSWSCLVNSFRTLVLPIIYYSRIQLKLSSFLKLVNFEAGLNERRDSHKVPGLSYKFLATPWRPYSYSLAYISWYNTEELKQYMECSGKLEVSEALKMSFSVGFCCIPSRLREGRWIEEIRVRFIEIVCP